MISAINSVFTNTNFNKSIIDASYFQQINLMFIYTSAFYGIKIHDGDASMVNMTSLQFRNINLSDVFLYFNSLQSTLLINDFELFSFSLTTGKTTISIYYFYLKDIQCSEQNKLKQWLKTYGIKSNNWNKIQKIYVFD